MIYANMLTLKSAQWLLMNRGVFLSDIPLMTNTNVRRVPSITTTFVREDEYSEFEKVFETSFILLHWTKVEMIHKFIRFLYCISSSIFIKKKSEHNFSKMFHSKKSHYQLYRKIFLLLEINETCTKISNEQ
jgi:hypothetical protein